MTAPVPRSSRPFSLALDQTLALSAGLCWCAALFRVVTPVAAARALDEDPGVRAAGLVLAVLGWMLLVAARRSATGERRFAGRVAAVLLLVCASARFVGVDAFAVLGVWQRFSSAQQEGLAGLLLLLTSAGVYFTSPARR